ncbi:hypothetical protein D3C72_1936240 [compost metagenome]
MLLLVGRRHEHADILAGNFVGLVAELAHRRHVEGFDATEHIDHDRCVRNRVEDRLQMRLLLDDGASAGEGAFALAPPGASQP